MKLTLYVSDVIGKQTNCYYKKTAVIENKESLVEAIQFDNVSAKYKNFYRSNDNFECSDNIVMDCDNDHSDNAGDWIDENKIQELFADVDYVLVFSRNHQKQKKERSPRPRFHVYFPIKKVESLAEFVNIKNTILENYPFFDKGAKDGARFIYGTKEKEIIWHEGTKTILDLIKDDDDSFEKYSNKKVKLEIKQGERNVTASKYAGKIIKKYGDTDEAYKAFLDIASSCEPPLELSELKNIWSSAQRFYQKKIKNNPNYIESSKYNEVTSIYDAVLMPEDLTDLGQATIFSIEYREKVRYSPATDYLVYNGAYWEESRVKAQGLVQELTNRQIKEVEKIKKCIKKKMDDAGITSLLEIYGTKKIGQFLTDEQIPIYNEYLKVLSYDRFVIGERDSRKLSATFKEAKPMILIDYKLLDQNEFLLNTPSNTIDLRKGIDGSKPHNASDYLTKSTTVSPSDKGMKMWIDCIHKIFGNDQELIDYVQMICGLATIGKVYVEALIISYGEGGNGKSTFWNTIAKVLGNYYGKISAEALTVNCKRNVRPEMAELKGKRLIIAAESQEGARLNDSIVKQLCSTDDVEGEKKFKDPFSFKPCHTLVLYTNHLPKISGSDDGMWRRLIVIPFENKLTGLGDIKNYSDYLYQEAGEAVLTWIIEGAKKVIDINYNFKPPKCVSNAINEYRVKNDWFHNFLDDCCDVNSSLNESSNRLYSTYRNYCIQSGEYVRSTTDFYDAVEKAGFIRFTNKRIKFIKGLKIREDDILEDFV